MSACRLTFDGLEELKAALRQLPVELVEEARGVVVQRAEQAGQDIAAAYPEITGTLKRKVLVKTENSIGGVKAVVKSGARHAHLYEFGTQARHTEIGANRGAMPPGRVFIPIAQRIRRALTDDLIGIIRRAGLLVRGA